MYLVYYTSDRFNLLRIKKLIGFLLPYFHQFIPPSQSVTNKDIMPICINQQGCPYGASELLSGH